MYKILAFFIVSLTFLFSSEMAVVQGLDPRGDGFLSIRTKPHKKEVGRLYNGDKVKILSQRGKYYKVRNVASGQVGWAYAKWIHKLHVSTAQTGMVFGLDDYGDGFLALRAKANGRQIGRLYNGDKVTLLDKRGKWYKVRTFSTGQLGWTHSRWIKVQYKR